MARVFVDTSVVSQGWFRPILEELIDSPNVRFTYVEHKSMGDELELARRLGAFYKRMGDSGRRDDVLAKDAERHIDFLENHKDWKAEGACDDPHVFAMSYVKPTPFVFTADKRLAKCRTCMNRVVDARYCSFRLVASRKNYNEKRAVIRA